MNVPVIDIVFKRAVAFLYNALGIPMAGGVLYPFVAWLFSPIIAGAAISVSSVSDIGNDLPLSKMKVRFN